MASSSAGDAALKEELEAEMAKLFAHFEQDENSATKLAKALEQDSTAAALHFALFPRCARDGGLRPTCREPVVSMMAFVVDLFSPHDGSVNLLSLAENFRPAPDERDEGIVGLSYQYKDETGESISISRGKVKEAKRQFAHQVQLRLQLPANPNISVKVFKTGRLQIAGCKDEPTCKAIIVLVLAALNHIQRTAGTAVFERHVCEPSGQFTPIKGPLTYEHIVKPETVNINCTFDAGYSFVGYTLDPVALKEVVERKQYQTCIKSVEYTPEKRYAGLKIIFRPPQPATTPLALQEKREVFIGIFPSSKTVITGAVNWAEVDDVALIPPPLSHARTYTDTYARTHSHIVRTRILSFLSLSHSRPLTLPVSPHSPPASHFSLFSSFVFGELSLSLSPSFFLPPSFSCRISPQITFCCALTVTTVLFFSTGRRRVRLRKWSGKISHKSDRY